MNKRLGQFGLILGMLAAFGARPVSGAGALDRQVRLVREIDRLNRRERKDRWAAAKRIVEMGPTAVPTLITVLSGEHLAARRMAAWILGELKDDRAIMPLKEALAYRDNRVRWNAASALVKLKPRSVRALIAALEGHDLWARRAAAWALAEIRDPTAGEPLARAVLGQDDNLRWKAATGLAAMGDPVIGDVRLALASADPAIRQCGAWILGQMGTVKALEELQTLIRDTNAEVKVTIAQALGHMNQPQVVPLLEQLQKDEDAKVARAATVSLRRRKAMSSLVYVLEPRAAAVENHLVLGEMREVRRGGILEIGLTPRLSPTLANPFQDARAWAELSSPDGKISTVEGFYDGDSTWRVRFSPNDLGGWVYQVSLEFGETQLSANGSFECVPGTAPAPLAVDPDRPSHLWAEGKVFFLLSGGTTYLDTSGPDELAVSFETWRERLHAVSQWGGNHVRILLSRVLSAKERRQKQGGLCPWHVDRKTRRYDLARFDLTYWRKLDTVLRQAQSLGIYVELAMFDEGQFRRRARGGWQDHPFNAMRGGPLEDEALPHFYDLAKAKNRSAQEQFVRYLIARTAGYPHVLYQLNRRMNRRGAAGAFGIKWVQATAALFRKHDPQHRLLALDVAVDRANYAAVGAASLFEVPYERRLSVVAGRPTTVMISQLDDPGQPRDPLWRALLAGAAGAGFSRGIWRAHPDAIAAAAVATFLERMNPAGLRPDGEALEALPMGVQGVAAKSTSSILAYLTGRCETGKIYIKAEPGRYRAQWYDPARGLWLQTKTVRSPEQVLEIECLPFQGDLVLWLEKRRGG